jgi:hypothetical protein
MYALPREIWETRARLAEDLSMTFPERWKTLKRFYGELVKKTSVLFTLDASVLLCNPTLEDRLYLSRKWT